MINEKIKQIIIFYNKIVYIVLINKINTKITNIDI